ncbi:MAG TPA: hypothetical protein VIM59_00640 [Cellvibrio sp.]
MKHVARRLLVRNEPQHDHLSAIIKNKIHVALIGFPYYRNNVPFAIMNVAVRSSPATYLLRTPVNLYLNLPLQMPINPANHPHNTINCHDGNFLFICKI